MEKQEKVVLTLDPYEHGIMIRALNELRNDMLDEERATDAVDDVLLKTIDAPSKKAKNRIPEKSQDFLGEGRTTECVNLCPNGAKRAKRSLRERDEAR